MCVKPYRFIVRHLWEGQGLLRLFNKQSGHLFERVRWSEVAVEESQHLFASVTEVCHLDGAWCCLPWRTPTSKWRVTLHIKTQPAIKYFLNQYFLNILICNTYQSLKIIDTDGTIHSCHLTVCLSIVFDSSWCNYVVKTQGLKDLFNMINILFPIDKVVAWLNN